MTNHIWNDPRVTRYMAGGSYDRVTVPNMATARELIADYTPHDVELKWLPDVPDTDGTVTFQVR